MKHAESSLTIEGNISDILGVSIERKDEFYHLINNILKELRLDQSSTIKRPPGMLSKVVLRQSESKEFDQHLIIEK
jgi:hypothetical protein